MLKYQCERLDKTFRWWFFNGSLVPGLSTCFDTVIMWMLVYNDVTSIETRMVPEGDSWIPFFEDNHWCLSNVRATIGRSPGVVDFMNFR